MPIDVLTGQPGNGKTALMVERLLAAAEKADRPIVEAGIDGLAPGLAMHLADPRKWNEVDPDAEPTCNCSASAQKHGHVIPDGALIFIDEAWKWFGHLHDATRQVTPAHVLALAEHRHRGIDFVWTTQMPNQIYPFTRGLIGSHTHVIRRYGTSFIDLFTWGELNEDVKSQGKRDVATRETRTLPSAVFDKYKSATIHTIKRKLPWKIIVLPIVIIATLVVGFFAYRALKPENIVGDIDTVGAGSGVAGAAPEESNGKETRLKITTAADYAAAFSPLIAGQPWTAPALLDRSVTVDPIVICVSSTAGTDGNDEYQRAGCRCMTEQGTRYQMEPEMCRDQARHGPAYNPYRQVQKGSQDRDRDEGAGQSPAKTGRATAAPEGFNGDDPYQTRYGQFRGNTPSADPSFGG